MQTVYCAKELAERWGLSTGSVRRMEQDGKSCTGYQICRERGMRRRKCISWRVLAEMPSH